MDIRKVILYDCRIDVDFKEVSKNTFRCVAKAKFNDVDDVLNIVLIEINKQQLSYLELYDYKNNDLGYFDIKGYFEIKKNKKDVPFLLFKATSIKLSSKRVAENKRNQEKKKKKKKELKINLENNICTFKDWYKKIEFLGLEKKVLDASKVKFLNEEHLKTTSVEFDKKYILYKDLIAVVEPIENSNNYKLILGWKSLVAAKLFDREITCYITNKTKDELCNEFLSINLEDENNSID